MKVLLTNIWLCNNCATEMYIHDLAIALKLSGIEVEVYSPELGRIAQEIRNYGINVVSSLNELKNIPDIIHGHHSKPTLDVINKFEGVPVVYFCHSGVTQEEEPAIHPQIVKYIGVDNFCAERLLNHPDIDNKKVGIIYNWVNTEKFKQKQINQLPKRALIFSNTIPKSYVEIIKKSCDAEGIQLDTIGLAFGNAIPDPESILGDYDIVFTKAKSAMEAMSCGCAVIMCDYAGFGCMVTTKNFEYTQKYNFGFHNLDRTPDVNLISDEIKKYNHRDVKEVSDLVREKNNFKEKLSEIISLYHKILNK